MHRRPRIFRFAGSLLIALWISTSLGLLGASAHESVDRAMALIEADHHSGVIDANTAQLLRLQRIFEPDLLPSPYREAADRPLRCATVYLHEMVLIRDELPLKVRQQLDAWLAQGSRLARATEYLSEHGRFRLSYEVTGTHAVPLTDVAPANGIPDFVERCAQYLEESWDLQFVDLGFATPDLSAGPYQVTFQSMGSYGYTTTQGAGPAGTRIVLNNDFIGFPPNQDPEGNDIGAAKVTCVHELRHASQFVASGWSEPGLWVEVDATWIEDIGYDYVNDYYNYLSSGSPISNPTLPLDAGGSGSYEDCVWQHYMTERWNIAVIQAFWQRRAAQPGEDVMSSYDWAMQLFGGTVLENFVEFAMWNHATGARAWPGAGYEEASGYPTAPVADQATALPASFTHPIQRYSARFYQFTGFTLDQLGVAAVTVNRAPDSPLRAIAVVVTRAGSRVVEPLQLTGAQDVIELATPSRDISQLTVVVAHGGIGVGTQTVTVSVEEIPRAPIAVAQATPSIVSFQMQKGDLATFPLTLGNIGEAGSTLDYLTIAAMPTLEATAGRQGAPLARSIEGSFISVDLAEYTPGTTAARTITVGNASRDFEWLAGVEVTVPSGVTVLGSTDFVGGTDGPLVTNEATGEGVTVVWSDLNGGWGNVRNGQLASATLWLSFDLQLVGDLSFDYRIIGDGYGAEPHEVTNTFLLEGPEAAVFELLAPSANVPFLMGTLLNIEWVAGFTADVRIELSRNDGADWESIVESTENDGLHSWIVSGPSTSRARLRLSEIGGTTTTTSPAPFALLELSPWMGASPAEGTISAGQTATVQLHFNATELAPGSHEALLFFFTQDGQSPLEIPINLTVTPGGSQDEPRRNRIQMAEVSPNPFNPTTSLRFLLSVPSHMSIDVYDVRGRFVRSLIDRELPAGPHMVTWDSRDDEGAYVSSGVYYYVASAGDGVRLTGKVVLSK